MQAFHNKQEIKDKFVARVRAHMEADEIVKGVYWQEGKGCAVGCTIEGSEHFRYETELGIPEILARLEDGLFEEMSNKDAKKFPLEFIEAIPVGADLSDVFKKLVIWEWRDEVHGLKNIKEIKEDSELYQCCEDVCVLYERTLAGEKVSDSEWIKLENLADKIYDAGAWAWAWAWAWVWAWAWARVWAGAEYEKQIKITADKLVELLKEAK